MNRNADIPVYFVTGILESGKTSFLNDTVRDEYFRSNSVTLLITCEEGIIEYDEAELKKYGTALEYIEEQEDFTPEKLAEFNKKYKPERVLLEFNPLWGVDEFFEMKLPQKWIVAQEIVFIDGTTYKIYKNNMQPVFTAMLKNADLVVMNRCNREENLAGYRRGIKVVNPACDIIFEDTKGEIINLFEEHMPYDMNAPVIEIEDVDYGIFYVDLTDHPEKYIGKTVKFKARAMKSKKKDSKFFVPGRQAMTCCAEDVQVLGYLCKSDAAPTLKHGQWVCVTAEIKYESVKFYQGKGPVLYASSVEPCDPPEEEMVYFN